VEQRRWRLGRALNQANGRITTGSAEVEWATEEPPQDRQEPCNLPATRSGRRLSGLTSAVAARSPTHTAVRGITTVDASTTTHAEVRAATTGTSSRATTTATARAAPAATARSAAAEGPAEDTAAAEEHRNWEEEVPRVSPREPRTRGRPEPCTPPKPRDCEGRMARRNRGGTQPGR